MVSHEQRSPIAVRVIRAASLLAILTTPAFTQPGSKKFYADDPILREPPPRAVGKVAHRDVDDLYDFLENSFVVPRRESRAGRQAAREALDINTIGDVPDSAWYTSRHYYRRMSIDELKRGPDDARPPAAAAWPATSAKT